MKVRIYLVIGILLILMGCSKTNIIKTDNGIVLNMPVINRDPYAKKLLIEVLSPEIIKVSYAFNDSALYAPSLVAKDVLADSVHFSVYERNGIVQVITDSLIVAVEPVSENVRFYDIRNRLLLSENGNEIKPFTNAFVGKQNHVIQKFDWADDEALYGLGQHRHGQLNLRGLKIDLTQENIEVSVPFLLSNRGYGLLWDNYSRTVFNDVADSSYLYSEIGDKIQYYFIKGSTFDEIIAHNRKLTGEVPMYPRWALGYMQSRNRYRSESELMGVVEKQRALKIPMDVIILDYYHWGDHGFGSFVFDENEFPNPEKMISNLHEKYNCKLLVSVWPSITPKTKNWELFNKDGYLLDVMAGFNTQVYDAFNPAAGKLYYDLINEAYLKKGVDGWWFDATEPENMGALCQSKCYLGAAAKYSNVYSYFDMRNVYERQIKDTDKRVFILTRSGFSGQQKFGTTVWSGDIESTFDELKKQIPAGLNFCMSGIPYWTTDIGGYKGGNAADPAYQEVFTRWFQYGTFCPIFRAHGRRYPGDRSGANEMWSYGKEKQKILTDYIKLRYRLMPYIYSLSHQVSSEGFTIMRGLPFDFMADKKVSNIDNQFMFGHELMVCPVTDAGATSRTVYLPEGHQWFDFWTGKKYEGGQEIEADAPIEKIPLFVKAGSIIPIGPVVQYSTEKTDTLIELWIYPGADASFTLYEDENDNFNYTEGAFLQIPVKYNDTDKTVSIGSSVGNYQGCTKERYFHIVLADTKNKPGVEGHNSTLQVIKYKGKEVFISL